MTAHSGFGPFAHPFAEADANFVAPLLEAAKLAPEAEARVAALARRLIEALRLRNKRLGDFDDLLHEYSLSSEEGLALMVLAEALLRVPDDQTADRLIADKLASPHWEAHASGAASLVVSASAWALGLSSCVIDKARRPEGLIAGLAQRLGMGTLRVAARQAMRIMGNHFVLGETIEAALKHAATSHGRLSRYSFDMLGEGARTAKDAEHYLACYTQAIDRIGASAGPQPLPERHGISIKLSALHPRYEPRCRARVMAELTPRVLDLALLAKAYNLNLTIDAEEADRLELSLEVIEAVMADSRLAGWHGFGLAVQAYQKRSLAVIEHVIALAQQFDRKLMVRLVKGAYWDTEIKRAQERGLADYPVFTRKALTDLNYIRCAKKMLAARPAIFPQFATHNALTIATLIEFAGGVEGYEFQRLHGMGEKLYDHLRKLYPAAPCRVYAPVGVHENLLAYLVRRLLENGANSSFVAQLADPDLPIGELLAFPWIKLKKLSGGGHPLPVPRDLHAPLRQTALGIEPGEREATAALLMRRSQRTCVENAAPILAADGYGGESRAVRSPIDGKMLGRVTETRQELLVKTMADAKAGFFSWSRLPVAKRAACFDAAAAGFESDAAFWIGLLQGESGKTLEDAMGEWREAIDFCRYYAVLARQQLAKPLRLAGPTGEENSLVLEGRGVFICISPWNFPLSIFVGQIAAALITGNSVIAKPAAQTPLIAAEAVRLLHRSGVPLQALQFAPGDAAVGAALVSMPGVAGVVFTGSSQTAARINMSLAHKPGPIASFIAETGGINTMIADATALPEQVCDDVIASAFRSSGQRCSALRLLCVQEDVADKMIAMIAGAARELKLGDPRDLATDLGPVIDSAAQSGLKTHIEKMLGSSRVHYSGEVPASAPAGGFYVAPHIFEIDHVDDLREEIFGPILHVVRYKATELDRVLASIGASGYGLTLAVHSRIDAMIKKVLDMRLAGNCYVNRSMIGAVVGTQPFGGFGLSGTGPKAGGPHYLTRFCVERTITINTAAAGGNARLMSFGI